MHRLLRWRNWLLIMRNNFSFFILAIITIGLCSIEQLSAQVSSHAYSEWIRLDSYKGSLTKNAFKYMVHIQAENRNETNELEYEDWSMQVRVNGLITNSEGKTIDPSRISIQLRKFKSIPRGDPELEDFEAITTPIKLGYTDQYIINKSDEEIESEDYYQQWLFFFDIFIEGGDYLEEIKSWKQYPLNLTFTIRDKRGRVLTEARDMIRMQIYPEDIPPSGPSFGFEVNANASLNFTTPEDYTKQVENNADNSWLKVNSKKDYVITVQTNAESFQVNRLNNNYEGNSNIRVGVVSMEVEDREKSKKGPITLLSISEKTVFNGRGKNKGSDILNVRYFIAAEEARGLATKSPGEYATTLTYTLTPQ